MRLAAINALKAMTNDELGREAERHGLKPIEFKTRDSLRLAVIDKIIEGELAKQSDDPPPFAPFPEEGFELERET